ncbi:MAG: RsiV family protein [Bacteroidota bacterium]
MLAKNKANTFISDDKTLKIGTKEKCKCDGFFYGSNLQCFVIRDQGIGFVFGKYVVGPGSSGTPEILLDWNTLAPYLQPGFSRVPKK